ncbi:MAG: hypothetical protein RMJ98_08925 [Myxococcales bacterium]|nr:hypothetical protein [Polyangiaceae bacterium]MDW8249408.1 hypothetical protein [Myxococcales bacterium]
MACKFGIQRNERSTIVLITIALGVGMIGWYLLQEEHNALSAVGHGRAPR